VTAVTDPLIVAAGRRAAARWARVTVLVVIGACSVLAVFALSVVPAGEQSTRAPLKAGAIALAALAALAGLRLWRVVWRADRLLGAAGELLAITQDGVAVAGDVRVPWDAISGVWALDRGERFRAQVQRPGLIGVLPRLMDRAGTSTIDLTIGIADTRLTADPRCLLTRHGAHRGRIELAFGAWHGVDELAMVMQALAEGLTGSATVRYCDGVLDYAAAWAGTADADNGEGGDSR